MQKLEDKIKKKVSELEEKRQKIDVEAEKLIPAVKEHFEIFLRDVMNPALPPEREIVLEDVSYNISSGSYRILLEGIKTPKGITQDARMLSIYKGQDKKSINGFPAFKNCIHKYQEIAPWAFITDFFDYSK